MARTDPMLSVRLPPPVLEMFDLARGDQDRTTFLKRLIEEQCSPEAARAGQTAGTYDEGLRRGRTQGQRYAEMAYFLSTANPDTPAPTGLHTWATRHPADWLAVERLLLNSPYAAAFAEWHGRHGAGVRGTPPQSPESSS